MDGEGNYLYALNAYSYETTKLTAPLADQFLSFVILIEAHTFNHTFEYDPEIRLTSLFDVNESNNDNTGLIVGLVVAGVVVVIGALVLLAVFNQRFRRSMMPFLDRRKQDSVYGGSRDTILDGEAELKRRDNQWEKGDTRASVVRNTITE
jgi:hypothetical protein